ncbi:hypothetical protein V8F33_005919 [Rhypophila sp. PSN 637]
MTQHTTKFKPTNFTFPPRKGLPSDGEDGWSYKYPIVCWAYADDTNLLVSGKDVKENLKVIGILMREFCDQFQSPPGREWVPITIRTLAPGEKPPPPPLATDYVGFANFRINPGKSKLTNYRRSGAVAKKSGDFKHLPKIKGLTVKESIVTGDRKDTKRQVKLLGVWLDPRLKMDVHVDRIVQEVRNRLRLASRFSSPTQGTRLLDLRQYFTTHTRPIMGYAAGAWFWRCSEPDCPQRNPRGLGKGQQKQLKSLQGECLRQFSGALWLTGRSWLELEMNIEDIVVWLSNTAARRRAQLVLKGQEDGPRALRNCLAFLEPLKKPGHHGQRVNNPYYALHQCFKTHFQSRVEMEYLERLKSSDVTSINLWTCRNLNIRLARNAIKSVTTKARVENMKHLWNDYQRNFATERGKRIDELDVARLGVASDTCPIDMLIQLRSQNIDLQAYLKRIAKVDSSQCGCGAAVQDVDHVFFHCPLLAEVVEAQLYGHPAVQCRNMYRLMTEFATHLTAFAIINLGLEQFEPVVDDYDILF